MSVAVSAVGKLIEVIALVAKTFCSTNSDCEVARNVQLLFSGGATPCYRADKVLEETEKRNC